MKRIVLFFLLLTCIGILSQINVSATELISNEMIELRTSNSKTFQTDDGNGKMVLYNHDIHFFENGKYNDIDMSLVKNKNTYQTKNSNYQISLPETLAKGNLIEVQHQDSSIKFYYPNSIESNFSVSNDLGSKGIEKAQSQLTYNNIKSNTDLVLDLSPTQLKESFVLSEYVEDFKVDYYLILNNLSMVSLEDSSLIFINPQGEIIFEFEPYFMFDSNEVYSDDVTVTFEEVFKGFYRFQVKPNQKWLSNNERVYPVIIDPIVNFTLNSSNQLIRDKYCYQGSSSCLDNSYLRVQYDDLYFVEPLTETLVFSLIEFDIETIFDNIMDNYNTSNYNSIDSIKFKLYLKDNFTPSNGILVQDVKNPISFDNMDGQTSYAYDNIDVISGPENYYEFFIDNEVYKYNMLDEDFIMRLYPNTPFVRYSTRFYSSNYSSSTHQPLLEITFGDWFISDTRTHINCYAFALGLDSERNPGYDSGSELTEYTSLSLLAQKVKSDLDTLGISYTQLSSYDSNISSNEYMIGMRIGYNPQDSDVYHIIRRDYGKGWVSKNGSLPSVYFVSQHVDPASIIWSIYMPNDGGPYDTYFGDIVYLAIEIEP
jgi:hypothetical protein